MASLSICFIKMRIITIFQIPQNEFCELKPEIIIYKLKAPTDHIMRKLRQGFFILIFIDR